MIYYHLARGTRRCGAAMTATLIAPWSEVVDWCPRCGPLMTEDYLLVRR